MDTLNAISPLDGRYSSLSAPLAAYFSERALQRHRLEVEILYFSLLCGYPKTGIRRLSKKELAVLTALKDLSAGGARRIKALEARTRHDVKAAEYFIKERLSRTTLKDLAEFVHFALTSEDINNFAYALMLSRALSAVMLPALKELLSELKLRAKLYGEVPLLARTHGQPAVGTTFGKEFAVFAARLQKQITTLERSEISVKFSGAAGNYNAHLAAYPAIDWPAFSAKMTAAANKGLAIKLVLNPAATQIEPHDTYAELFDALRRANTVLLDLAQDMWRYISSDLVIQKNMAGETGSSTMPQKINPIQFENAEGNLGLANALLSFFSAKLPVSRLQRDLSDSTVERNFGAAFAHSFIAWRSLAEGLRRSEVNAGASAEELENHPEIYAEALQTVLRREDFKNPYEALKKFTRGRKITRADLENFIGRLTVKEKVKKELLALIAKPYTGLAAKIARKIGRG
ncbi:MAG: adenylosuccinate lyase [Elusimicrobia bacterium]|nr:adenylosuccinate lyase [Elusimicrobiota bacterium]